MQRPLQCWIAALATWCICGLSTVHAFCIICLTCLLFCSSVSCLVLFWLCLSLQVIDVFVDRVGSIMVVCVLALLVGRLLINVGSSVVHPSICFPRSWPLVLYLLVDWSVCRSVCSLSVYRSVVPSSVCLFCVVIYLSCLYILLLLAQLILLISIHHFMHNVWLAFGNDPMLPTLVLDKAGPLLRSSWTRA